LSLHDALPILVARRGLNPFALVVREILERHGAAERRRLGDERVRHLALVEAVAAMKLEQAQGLGEIGIAEDLAGDWRLTVNIPGLHGVGIELGAATLERQSVGEPPVMSDALRDWEAVLGVIDGGRQHLLETHLAEGLKRLLPTPGSARHCNR